MIDLQQHYDQLWQKGKEKIETGSLSYDLEVESTEDQRFGITLLARPDSQTQEKIFHFCKEMEKIEPGQYYYPKTDFHITILSIISCYDGFSLNQIDVEKYIDVISPVLSKYSDFQIRFEGIAATDSAVLVQGFPQDRTLEELRNEIRHAFRITNLEHAIDKRYKLETAHSTIIRFTQPLEDAAEFLSKLKEYRNYKFGCCTIRNVELVFNDWYQKLSKVTVLKDFIL